MPIRIAFTVKGSRETSAPAFKPSVNIAAFVVGATTPAPVLPRYVVAVTSWLAFSFSALTTCAAVLVAFPDESVAKSTKILVPSTVTFSGALLVPGFLNSTDTSFPPLCPHAFEETTTARLVVPPIVAWARRL
ncbi:hypothetical protein SRABI80_04236 [Peribacillus frigoritolerans]|nr:hypothetical protein SRABI80_04236 [Peribacillus frigoritolerans]